MPVAHGSLVRGAVLTTFALHFVPMARAEEETCVVLCPPALKLEPTFTIGNLVGSRTQNATTCATRTLPPEAGFELSFALAIPTQVRRVRLTFEGILTIPGRQPELEAELNLMLVTAWMTAGWIEAHLDLVCQLSPGRRPGTEDTYTPKLDFELDVALSAFNWLPLGHWLRNIEIEASLDYLATGLARRGDVIDGERYLEDAHGWAVSFLLVIPLAPLVPR